MTQEEKQLLLKDLCARLPYGVRINHIIYGWEGNAVNFNKKLESFAIEKDNGLSYDVPVEEVRPYLRPMSSMTDEEVKEFYDVECMDAEVGYIKPTWNWHFTINGIDWLNEHHFDYRGLINKRLALEAPEGMYESKNN